MSIGFLNSSRTFADSMSNGLVRAWRRLRSISSHAIARTAAVNMFSVVATTMTGVFLARSLGEVGRGNYASVVVWFGLALVLGEVGQSAACTYCVARAPDQVKAIVAASRLIMLIGATVVVSAGVALAPMLSGNRLEQFPPLLVLMIGVVINAVFGPFVFALQALSLRAWNLVRLSQPVWNLLAVAACLAYSPLTVLTASLCLVLSYLLQMVVALLAFGHVAKPANRRSALPIGAVTSFGLRQSVSAVPQAVAGGLDRMVLSQVSAPAVLGSYAVAQSVVTAAAPLGSAIASVAFPRLSAFSGGAGDRKALEIRLLRQSAVVVSCAALLLALVSPWAIPLVFGREFLSSVELVVWLVAPAVANSLLGVATAVLRGRGEPGRASVAQIVMLGLSAVSMYLLVPDLGGRGAAIAMAVGSISGLGLALVLMRMK